MGNAPRKYVDLIKKADGKWANWDPSRISAEVGDYGIVSMESAEFEKEGSIYDDNFEQNLPDNLKPLLASLKTKYPPVTEARDSEIHIKSSSVRKADLATSPELGFVGDLSTASIKGTWKFEKRRGAVLLLTKPRITSLPRNVLLKQLVDIPALQDKFLVTGVVKCPAYALYLSSLGADEVSFALSAKGPVPHASGVAASAEINGGWWSKEGNGILKKGGHPGGSDSFLPLFSLKMIRKPFFSWKRDSLPPERKDDDLWRDAEEPWGVLDSEGEEDEIDAGSDIPDFSEPPELMDEED